MKNKQKELFSVINYKIPLILCFINFLYCYKLKLLLFSVMSAIVISYY